MKVVKSVSGTGCVFFCLSVVLPVGSAPCHDGDEGNEACWLICPSEDLADFSTCLSFLRSMPSFFWKSLARKSTMRLSKSSPPRWVSPAVDNTSNTPSPTYSVQGQRFKLLKAQQGPHLIALQLQLPEPNHAQRCNAMRLLNAGTTSCLVPGMKSTQSVIRQSSALHTLQILSLHQDNLVSVHA